MASLLRARRLLAPLQRVVRAGCTPRHVVSAVAMPRAFSPSVGVSVGRPRFMSTDAPTAREKIKAAGSAVDSLPEVRQRAKFHKQLAAGEESGFDGVPLHPKSPLDVGLGREQMMRLIEVSMATFLLHVEARLFSYVGEGYYTIGPCGEEAMGALGLALRQTDPAALHYRHVTAQMARQAASGKDMDEILLDRARGYVVSALDPVTGGAHCAIGGGPADYAVTSTLSSQTPPAVGRALATPLAHMLKVDTPFPRDAVNVVSLGDGSVNNGHYLTAANLAAYSEFRGRKCPVLFVITDNDRCISLRGYRWIQQFARNSPMPVFSADGHDVLDVYQQSERALADVRSRQRPAMLLVENVPRRFGHAATDRQIAYTEEEEILRHENANPLGVMCVQAVRAKYTTFEELTEMMEDLQARVEVAFDKAGAEPKLTDRQHLLDRVSAPLVPMPESAVVPPQRVSANGGSDNPKSKKVMRQHMTRVIAEELEKDPSCVYIGEDVRHGGYYLVTDGLVKKFPNRVHDFPPDETTLVGAGVGFSQAGLLPIVEIPYAKYLDCGADMFFEAVLAHWLTNGRQPNGMMVRLQGFGDGVFGGNFHTHNSLHIPPGLDVVCYSNGRDYARGFRYGMRQAKAGRVVMSADSTNLLNLRHLHGNDLGRMQAFTGGDEEMDWDTVRTHNDVAPGVGTNRLAIVTYGNGVVTSLQAQKLLEDNHGIDDVVVIDSPYLSTPPAQLRELLPGFDAVVFADVCKDGQHPFAGFITKLHSWGELPAAWRCVAAQPTYNPLGHRLTFVSADDIVGASLSVLGKQ